MNIKNWRPLMLQNDDVKLVSKTLAIRMMAVLPKLIGVNQLAYVKGRFIGEGAKIIEGIIEFVKQTEGGGYLLAIDFEKAFDSVEWEFLWHTLSSFGFPVKFINMMKMLYSDVEACVINSGTTSKYFPITRGVKQGDPPSGYLFILVAELLLIKFRSNKAIQGIEINRMEVKLSAYADDINNFLRDLNSVKNTLVELDKYEKVSGLRCNPEKCEIMSLGNSTKEDIEFCGHKLKWVSEIVICGIIFGINSHDLTSKNYEPVTEKLISKLNMWKMRDLSLIGKIQVLKTYGISQVQDVMNVIEPTTEILNNLNKIIFNFLWGGNTDKVKRKAMISDYDQGGLKAPDIFIIHKVQRIMWVS